MPLSKRVRSLKWPISLLLRPKDADQRDHMPSLVNACLQHQADVSVTSPYHKLRRSAVIQYMGIPGSSADCRDAIVRLLQHGDHVISAQLLTYGSEHAFMLSVNTGERI